MTVKQRIKQTEQRISQAEQAAKAKVLAEVNKQESWLKVNRLPLILGAAVGFLIAIVLFQVF